MLTTNFISTTGKEDPVDETWGRIQVKCLLVRVAGTFASSIHCKKGIVEQPFIKKYLIFSQSCFFRNKASMHKQIVCFFFFVSILTILFWWNSGYFVHQGLDFVVRYCYSRGYIPCIWTFESRWFFIVCLCWGCWSSGQWR